MSQQPWQSQPMKPDQCPKCKATFTHAATSDGSRPRAGDFTICLRCADILVWDITGQWSMNAIEYGVMTLRAPTPEEWREVLANPEFARPLKRLQQQVIAMIRTSAARN